MYIQWESQKQKHLLESIVILILCTVEYRNTKITYIYKEEPRTKCIYHLYYWTRIFVAK